jgi:hypothetical protein
MRNFEMRITTGKVRHWIKSTVLQNRPRSHFRHGPSNTYFSTGWNTYFFSVNFLKYLPLRFVDWDALPRWFSIVEINFPLVSPARFRVFVRYQPCFAIRAPAPPQNQTRKTVALCGVVLRVFRIHCGGVRGKWTASWCWLVGNPEAGRLNPQFLKGGILKNWHYNFKVVAPNCLNSQIFKGGIFGFWH